MALCQKDLIERAYFKGLTGFARDLRPDLFARDIEADRFAVPLASLPKQAAPQAQCEKCLGISLEALESEQGYEHHHLEDLIHSAKQCPACALIQEQICTSISWHARRQPRIKNPQEAVDVFARLMAKERLFVAKPTRIILSLDRNNETHSLTYVSIGTPLYPPPPVLGVKLIGKYFGRLLLHNDSVDSPQPIRPRGSEVDILRRLATWLRERESEVSSSNQKWDEAPLPTRLLDLGEADGGPGEPPYLESDIRLLETAGQRGRYVTLSYSWGAYKEFRTLKGNYEERKAGIPFKLLPPVFQQAIKVTRGLGIRYLWIDALCIIQEDAEDWSREAARMSEVYWMSAVRLAVTDSTNPTQAFFPPKENVSVRMPNLQALAPPMELGLFSSLPDSEQPKTEEERVMLRQHARDFLSMQRERMSMVLTGGEDELCSGKAVNRRMVDRPQDGATECPPMVRREGNILTKMPKPWTSTGEESCSGRQRARGSSLDGSFANGQGTEDSTVEKEYPVSPEVSKFYHEDKDRVMAKVMEDVKELGFDLVEKLIHDQPHKEEDRNHDTYLTLPRLYSVDVDKGHLNTRGWVLQERMLAPRTIHFTSDHIYCEDSDDICGEDWVRRHFTWMSSIVKHSTHAQLDLFPERSNISADNQDQPQGFDRNTWQRQLYWKPEWQHIEHPWLNIAKTFSECQLSFDSDRLVAIAGLVNRKSMDSKSAHANDRNLCGLWYKTLHVELAWLCKQGHADSGRIRGLRLPSWSWISHKGPIDFIMEPKSAHDTGTVLARAVAAFELVDTQVPALTEPLPLKTPALLMLRVAMRRIYGVSMTITKYGKAGQSRNDLAKISPFDFDPRTTTVPVSLSSLTECQEVYNEDRRLLGFVTFDEGIHVVGDLFCVHISTLVDEAFYAAENDLAKPGVDKVDMRDYQRPILAYALVMAKVRGDETLYRRVGIAEVNYHWMTSTEKVVIKIC